MGIGYDPEWLKGLGEARLRCDATDGSFSWEQIDSSDRQRVDGLLRGLAGGVVRRQKNLYLVPLRGLVEELGQRAIVILTHLDLLKYTSSITTDSLLRVFDEIFGAATDRFRSQEVLAGNENIQIQNDVSNPVIYRNRQEEGARQLWRAIKHRLGQGPTSAAGAGTEHDRLGPGDVIKLAVYRLTMWWPVLFLALLALAGVRQLVGWIGGPEWWVVPSWYPQHQFIGRTVFVMLAALPIGFALALMFEWLRAQLRAPAWQVRPPTIVFAHPVAGAVELPSISVRFHATVLGRVLGVGWATLREEQCPDVPGPPVAAPVETRRGEPGAHGLVVRRSPRSHRTDRRGVHPALPDSQLTPVNDGLG